jgi:hypothetical protein
MEVTGDAGKSHKKCSPTTGMGVYDGPEYEPLAKGTPAK